MKYCTDRVESNKEFLFPIENKSIFKHTVINIAEMILSVT